MSDDRDESERAQDDHERNRRRLEREDRSEENLLGDPGRCAPGRIEVQKECRQSRRKAEHDARRDVSPAQALHSHEIHCSRSHDTGAKKAKQRTDVKKNAPEPPVVATSVSAWPAKD